MLGLGNSNMAEGQSMQNMAQVALGAMQALMGLLGLLASQEANKQGNKGLQNTAGLSGITPYSANSEFANGAGSSNTGSSSTSGGKVDISSPETKQQISTALASIEKHYGLPSDKVIDALKTGVNPKDILANATKNKPSGELLNKLEAGIHANNTAGKEAADRILASVGTGTGAAGGGLPATEAKSAGGEEASTAKGTKAPDKTDTEDLAAMDPNAAAALSPEVKAALADRAAKLKAEKESQDMQTWNIFQLVHNRYKKLEVMLYGRVEHTNPNPTGGIKSIQ